MEYYRIIMSDRKNKALKKLKKKPIWPFVVGIIFLFSFLFIIYAINILIFTTNIVENKCYQSFSESKLIIDELNSNLFTDKNLAIKNINDIRKYNSQIIGTKVIKKSDLSSIYSFGKTDSKNPDFFSINDNLTFSIDTDEDLPFFYKKRNKIKIRLSAVFNKLMFNNFNFENIRDTIFTFNITYKMNLQNADYYALITNQVFIFQSDLDFISVSFFILGIISLILFVFLIIIIIDFIVARFRVSKILYFDSVTGGNNWIYMQRQGDYILTPFLWYKKEYVMVNIRMEKYRNYCTCFGTNEGEELLEQIYCKLISSISKKEIAVRHEKADFCLLLCFTSKEEIEQRVLQMIDSIIQIKPDRKLYINAGLFLISSDCNMNGIDSYYNCSYSACSKAVKIPDLNLLWYSNEMLEEQLWERKVENDMEKALINKEFVVYLQPKYNTNEETLSAAEALVRWKSPTEGLIPPNKFIPIFEKDGFILKLDDYMLSEVSKLQHQWITEGKKVVPISVNVSRAHFTRSDLAEHICKLVDEQNVPHNLIELEITESAFFDDKSILLNTINKLKSYGFFVSMDDFGSGYSSLNTLKELPLDIVKLDAEFFRGKDEENKGKIIIEEIISLAKKLNMKIVAEGIETREQVDFLKTQGCDLIQGFYFARPLTIEDFEQKAF